MGIASAVLFCKGMKQTFFSEKFEVFLYKLLRLLSSFGLILLGVFHTDGDQASSRTESTETEEQ